MRALSDGRDSNFEPAIETAGLTEPLPNGYCTLMIRQVRAR
jgi:hypothetical protein